MILTITICRKLRNSLVNITLFYGNELMDAILETLLDAPILTVYGSKGHFLKNGLRE